MRIAIAMMVAPELPNITSIAAVPTRSWVAFAIPRPSASAAFGSPCTGSTCM
jgi:hypothetical protein